MRRLKKDRSSQKGMTLVETLVSVVIFTIVFLAALGLYQVANRAYLATDAATIQQQNARYAIDRITETLRDAGANYNTTGKSLVADEQIEGAWESAIFVRGDFDNEREGPPFNTLESSPNFPIVSTGNDEIVGYVLRKDGAGSINITIKADLLPATGRNAIKNGATITGEETSGVVSVAATNLAGQTNPPYQLARVTFDTAGNAVYQVIAENVFRLSFKHMNAAGAEVIDFDTASGSADAERDERATIRKIGVSIITLADRPDMGYTDPVAYTTDAFGHVAPAEGTTTRNRRKFTLTEEVFGVSLGRKGARHNAVPAVVIDAPESLTVCTGHHLSHYLTWPPSPTAGIATYQVSISHGSPAVTFTVLAPTTEYRYTQSDPAVEAYTFMVAGAAGSSIGTFTSVVTKTATHETPSIPSSPANVSGSQSAGANAMAVTWDPVTTNTGPITSSTCTTEGVGAGTSVPPAPWNNEAVDLKSHQVHRGLSPHVVGNGAFASTAGNRVDNVGIGDLVNTTPTAVNTFTDNTAAPCGQYFYRVRAFDSDNRVEPGDGSAAMVTAAQYIPDVGVTPAKPATPAPAGAVVTSGGNYNFTLDWTDVVRDSTTAKAATAHYEIVREQKLGTGSYTPISSVHVYEQTSVVQSVPTTVGTEAAMYRYAVKAVYDCTALGDVDRENQSDWYDLACSPPAGNSLSITVPANGSAVSRPYETTFTPTLAPVGPDWTGVTISIADAGGTVLTGYPVTISTAPPWTFAPWDSSSYPDGTYTMTVVGEAGACRSVPIVSTFELETGTCGLVIQNAVYTGNGSNAFRGLNFQIENTCDLTDMTVEGLQFNWTGLGTPPNPFIQTILYGFTTFNSGLTAVTGAMGTTIDFSGTNSAVITAGTTSSTFSIAFSDNMTSTLDGGGTPFQFTSILASVTDPATSTEEIVDTTPLTPTP